MLVIQVGQQAITFGPVFEAVHPGTLMQEDTINSRHTFLQQHVMCLINPGSYTWATPEWFADWLCRCGFIFAVIRSLHDLAVTTRLPRTDSASYPAADGPADRAPWFWMHASSLGKPTLAVLAANNGNKVSVVALSLHDGASAAAYRERHHMSYQ